MGPPCIAVHDLCRTYLVGDVPVHALRSVSLTIRHGEFVAIMGSSGSGKSTLMAILGCLDQPTSGDYLFEGRNVAHLSEPELADVRSERLGFVFQSFNLLARTSAIDNVALPLLYRRGGAISAAQRTRRAREALALLGLRDRENNKPAQLSGGQQQRVAIARALIHAPGLLLADEPTGNLDSRTSHDIMQALVRLNRERGLTIVAVTHEADIAAYAQRVITMRDGAVVSDVPRAGQPAPRPGPAPAAASAMPDSCQGTPHAWSFAMMLLLEAAQALRRNMTRSILTMLGVFIGVAALIAMIALGQGANDAVRKQIESLGTNLFVVVPGAATSGGARGGFGSSSSLTVADAEAIRRESLSVAAVSYLLRQNGQAQYRRRNWNTLVQGVSASYPHATHWRLAEGRMLTEEDGHGAAMVAVIGETVRRQLFAPGESPVGATILVRGMPLRVAGLYAAKGQTIMGQDQDDVIMVPFSTAERKVLGVAAPSMAGAAVSAYPPPPNPFGLQPRLTGYVHQIYVQASNAAHIQAAIGEVGATLARRHRIRAGDAPDFSIRNLSQIADTAENSSRVLASLLALVASISLLVGGIGIMNILLVSVTERTREVGLRMAIGAHRSHVLLQFLAEAIFMSVLGGAAGVLAGVIATSAVAALTHWPTIVSPGAVIGGFLFSAGVGTFFGYYPARKAARLNPIDALRYE